MVVDDEPDCLYSVKIVLENYDNKYEVVDASNALHCLRLLEEGVVPDLFLLYIMMPDIDGWTFYKKIKSNPLWEKIPIAFLSARTNEMKEKAQEFQAIAYIEKPFDIEKFKIKVDNKEKTLLIRKFPLFILLCFLEYNINAKKNECKTN